MHEVSVMEQALDLALRHANAAGAQRIDVMRMRIGDLSGVVADSLLFAFDIVSRGTIADGARLEIDHVPVSCHCRDCGTLWKPNTAFYECPACGGTGAEIREGREMALASLEVS